MKAKLFQGLEQVVESLEPSVEAVTVANRDGFMVSANPAALKIYKKEIDSFLNRHPLTLCPDDFSPQLSKEIFRATESDGKWEGIVINEDSAGKRFPILLRTKALKSKAGKVTAIISYAKPFPPETPFNLTKAQADVFQKYGEGLKDIEVAETLNISRSALAERRAGIVKKIKKSTGINATNLKKLAIDCLAAGWSAALELNKQIKS